MAGTGVSVSTGVEKASIEKAAQETLAANPIVRRIMVQRGRVVGTPGFDGTEVILLLTM